MKIPRAMRIRSPTTERRRPSRANAGLSQAQYLRLGEAGDRPGAAIKKKDAAARTADTIVFIDESGLKSTYGRIAVGDLGGRNGETPLLEFNVNTTEQKLHQACRATA